MTDHDDWEPPSESEMKLMQARRERSDKISKLMGDYLLKGYKMLATSCPECQTTILLQDRQGTNYCVACSELDTDTDKDDPVINQSAAMSMAREMELASAAAAGGNGSTGCGATASPTSTILTKQTRLSSQKASATASHICGSGDGAGSGQRTLLVTEGSPTSLSMTSIDVQSWPPNSSDIRAPQPQTTQGVRVKEDTDADSAHRSSSSLTTQTYPTKGDTLTIPQSPSALSSTAIQALLAKISWSSQELQGTHSVEYSIQLCQLIKSASDAIASVRTARI